MFILLPCKCLCAQFSKKCTLLDFLLLDKTLKGVRVVPFDNKNVFCAQGPRTKYF